MVVVVVIVVQRLRGCVRWYVRVCVLGVWYVRTHYLIMQVPWVIEVNTSPSLNSSSPLDARIKG